jgi:2-polyprenyl-3-methyl-5-hydroxy-6-metoxy-1,4-benzoquinol methylase
MKLLTDEQAREFLDRPDVKGLQWYHRIPVSENVATPANHLKPNHTAANNPYLGTWREIEALMHTVEFTGKSAIDVGCRDGKFSFLAESLEAVAVDAIDNDLMPGSELLARRLQSLVVFRKQSIYDITGNYDIVMAFGLLYHLRFPFLGLSKLADSLKPSGTLLLETAVLTGTMVDAKYPVLYCPVDDSPFEATSCSFFNIAGLITTLKSLGLTVKEHRLCGWPAGNAQNKVERALFKCVKTGDKFLPDYWHGTHTRHSRNQVDPHKP